MNPHKICFITCVNDDEMYQESLIYINHLIIPDGFEIEIIEIKDAAYITKAYNSAMRSSDAKYKVYLHQDVFIVNKNFITDIVDLFFKHPNTGMFGVAGSAQISTNGVWWESKQNYGKVYDSHTGRMQLLAFQEVPEEYQLVQVIDGLIMITQYDILWRDDIFTGWHFYDLSQSMEFIRAGYQVGIPCQVEPWCVHDCEIVNIRNEYESYKQVFLKEYSKNIFPLVSILIPTYNQTKYLQEALESALNQTYPNIEIIIGDDSTNTEVEEFIKKYKNITYFKNKRSEMDYGISNVHELLRRSKGEYINFLFHDDVFHTTKIEKMMNYFMNRDDISLVTSHRQLIDEDSHNLPDDGATKRLVDNDALISGKDLTRICLENLTNIIGEPTTVLFKKTLLKDGFGYFNKKSYRNIADLATWMSLLQLGNAVYMTETLSYFRKHASQNSQKTDVFLIGLIEWIEIIIDLNRNNFYENTDNFKKNVSKWFYSFNCILNNLSGNSITDNLREKVKDSFKLAIDIIANMDENRHGTGIEKGKNLIILDDIFPNLLSAFRIAEYNYYLQNISETAIYSASPQFSHYYIQYQQIYPQFCDNNIYKFNNNDRFNCSLFYTIFINNIYNFLPIIEKEETPFIFTLYPGGGFWLNQPESDKKLRRVFDSPYFRKVIVTQNITYNYLVNNQFCQPQQIEYIFGGVLPKNLSTVTHKKYYKRNKETFDVCFVATKYMEKGIDKGYDRFIDVAKELSTLADIRFHVIGGFRECDIDVTSLHDKIQFYGYQLTSDLQRLYKNMDIIVSPNLPFKQFPGAFDGFPTGCCVEAGLSGVMVLCTDELNLNRDLAGNQIFREGIEICIIPPDTLIIAEMIRFYYNHTDKLYEIAQTGANRIREVFNFDTQMAKRINVLSAYLR